MSGCETLTGGGELLAPPARDDKPDAVWTQYPHVPPAHESLVVDQRVSSLFT
jgi:hypothetical protein